MRRAGQSATLVAGHRYFFQQRKFFFNVDCSSNKFFFKGIVSPDWKACICFHWIDLKFKGNRYVFFLNLKCRFHNARFKSGAKTCALYPRISSRSRISRRGICASVVWNNYVKKMRHVGSADQPNCTHTVESVSSPWNCPLCVALEVRRSIPLREILLLRTC
jgi:hypothetical protein